MQKKPKIKNSYYSIDTILDLERCIFSRKIIEPHKLMQKAGLASLEFIKRYWPNHRSLTIICGKGNNAGDGLILAQEAYLIGYRVNVIQIFDFTELSALCKKAKLKCNENITFNKFTDKYIVDKDSIIVDAILGIGAKSKQNDNLVKVINDVNKYDNPIFSIDIPSGINPYGTSAFNVSVIADATITFLANKSPMSTGEGLANSGHVYLDKLGMPDNILSHYSSEVHSICENEPIVSLPKKLKNGHKASFGKLIIIGGSKQYLGALQLAALTAQRSGIGYVRVVIPTENRETILKINPSLIVIDIHDIELVFQSIADSDVVLIGPGLGKETSANRIIEYCVASTKTTVLDAGALYYIDNIKLNRNDILTPHPKEAAVLLNTTTKYIQENRLLAAKRISAIYDCICVLKGHGPIISIPDQTPFVCDAASESLAIQGSGDVLAGLIASLVMQCQEEIYHSVLEAVRMHSKAGELAEKYGCCGVVVGDIIEQIYFLRNQ